MTDTYGAGSDFVVWFAQQWFLSPAGLDSSNTRDPQDGQVAADEITIVLSKWKWTDGWTAGCQNSPADATSCPDYSWTLVITEAAEPSGSLDLSFL